MAPSTSWSTISRWCESDEPGAVFGDVALLLDQPHKADVRAVQPSSFFLIDDAERFLDHEPAVLLYIAKVLARRLDAVNHLLIEGRSRSAEAEPRLGFFTEMYHRISGALQIRVPRPGRRDQAGGITPFLNRKQP